MNPFDVFYWQPPGWTEPHPCVIVSHSARAQRKDLVEVVLCSTRSPGLAAEANELVLDQADGLDWPTLCKCDFIYAVPREDLQTHKGNVSDARRWPLIQKIISAHGWTPG